MKRQLPRPAFLLILSGYILVGVLLVYEFSTLRADPAPTPGQAAVPEETATLQSDGPQEDKPAPDFALKDVTGKVYHLSDFIGKVVVLNFWATWCPPCRREIPDFLELQRTYAQQGLQFVGIALDEEGAAIVKPYIEKSPFSYPILLPDHSIAAKYGEMNVIPTTFLIDRKGILRTHYVGMRQKKVLEDMVRPLLAER